MTRHGTTYGEPQIWLQRRVAQALEEHARDCVLDWPFSRGGQEKRPNLRWHGRHRWAAQVVLELTAGPRGSEQECCHDCGRGSCLNPYHLRWDTRRANMADAVRHGTTNRGSRAPSARLTDQDVLAIRSSNESRAVLAERYGVTRLYINDILARRRWTWLLIFHGALIRMVLQVPK